MDETFRNFSAGRDRSTYERNEYQDTRNNLSLGKLRNRDPELVETMKHQYYQDLQAQIQEK